VDVCLSVCVCVCVQLRTQITHLPKTNTTSITRRTPVKELTMNIG
jgi:hypothetical protein